MMMRFTRPALMLATPLLLAACAGDESLDHGSSVQAALAAQRVAPAEAAPGMITSRELEPTMERNLERRPSAPAAQR